MSIRFGFDFLDDVSSGDSGGSGGGSGSQTATVAGYVDQVMDKDGNIYDIKSKNGCTSYWIPITRTCYDSTDTISLATGDSVRQTFVDLLAQDPYYPPTSGSNGTYILGKFSITTRGGAGPTITQHCLIPAVSFQKTSNNSGIITWDYSIDGYWGWSYNSQYDTYSGGISQHRRYRSKLAFTIGSSSSQDSFAWETIRLDNDELQPLFGYNVDVTGSAYTVSVSNSANMHNVLRRLSMGACELEDVRTWFSITHSADSSAKLSTTDTYYGKPVSYSATVLGSATYGKVRVTYLVPHPNVNNKTGEMLEITDDVTFGATYSNDTHSVRINKISAS